MVLKIENIELPATYEVDFSNSEQGGTSVTMIGNADGVEKPTDTVVTPTASRHQEMCGKTPCISAERMLAES